jgi:ADP-ribose pyrophosphatase
MSIERKMIYEGRVIKVSVDTVVLRMACACRWKSCVIPGGAAVVAIDAQRRVCLLRQYRHAAGGYIYELPAGKLEPGEPPEATARRELVDEASVSATNWSSLGAYFSSPGVFTEVIHLYLATGSTPAAAARGRRGIPGRMVAAGLPSSAPQRRTRGRQDRSSEFASGITRKIA